MPKIFKRFLQPEADDYVLQPAEELNVKPQPAPEERGAEEETAEGAEGARAEPSQAEQEILYARIQAEAILADAREEAEAMKAQALSEAQEEIEALRKDAHDEGYRQGYSEGMERAAEEGRREREEMARDQLQAVEIFLEQAARERDRMLDGAKEELKDLAVAIAEKVIRVSLKNSGDIILRMVDAATDTHKRCEWVRIYVADCDVEGRVYTASELAAALGHLSGRIRVVPMADDESGTVIVEMPDVILDASVSTQLGSIREVLDNVPSDSDEGGPVLNVP